MNLRFTGRVGRRIWVIVAGVVVVAALVVSLVFVLGRDGGTEEEVVPRVCATQNLNNLDAVNNLSVGIADFSINLSREVFVCSNEVVIVSAQENLDVQTLASDLASSVGAPLLLSEQNLNVKSARVFGEVFRLSPRKIYLIGNSTLANSVEDLSIELNTEVQHFDSSDPEKISQEIARQSTAPVTDTGPLWLMFPDDREFSLPVLPALKALGGDLLFFDSADDLRSSTSVADYLRNTKREPQVIGDVTPEIEQQLNVIRYAEPLPNGKFLLFQGERMVAFYGQVGNKRSGILGQQATPEAALEAMRPYLDAYKSEGVETTPVFEMIATVADREPGLDGDYSREGTVEAMLPWVLAAKELGAYVVLDLQPGRTDFLTQAKLYEELLSYPNVGLALDPEWRLKPHQFHLEQFGSASADEVNQVVDWLANLVREKNLPQKLLVLHQFRIYMLPNRAQIQSPPELAVLINMDGLGTLEEKFAGYEIYAKHFEGESKRFFGWKIFFVFDSPPRADEKITLNLDPVPDFVNFQ